MSTMCIYIYAYIYYIICTIYVCTYDVWQIHMHMCIDNKYICVWRKIYAYMYLNMRRHCYGLNSLYPLSQCGGIRKWGFWEMIRSWGWTLHELLLWKRPQRISQISIMWEHSERRDICETRSRPSPDQINQFDLGLPSLQKCEKYMPQTAAHSKAFLL